MCIRDSQWGDPARIVSIDPWGASVQHVYADYLARGYDVRPTIAVTKACLLYTSRCV